jgi:hypothetical protein
MVSDAFTPQDRLLMAGRFRTSLQPAFDRLVKPLRDTGSKH